MAGSSAPEDQKGISASTWSVLIFGIFSPIGMAVAVAMYVALFSWKRQSWQVVATVAAALAALWVIFGGLSDGLGGAIGHYLSPWTYLIGEFRDGDLIPALKDPSTASYWFATQFPLSVVMGGGVASAMSGWKWFRRSSWDTESNRRAASPRQVLNRRRVVREIASDVNGPTDAITVGVADRGDKITQTDAEGAAHTFVAGGAGSGKTTVMLIGMRDVIRMGRGLIVVDLKGGADVAEELAEWANRYGRKFLHFSIFDRSHGYTGPADGPAYYDPVGRGDASRRKDLLIDSREWTEPFYKTVASSYLQLAFRIAEYVPNPNADSMTETQMLLEPENLKARAAALFMATALTPEGQQAVSVEGHSIDWREHLDKVVDPEVRDLLESVATTVVGMGEQEKSGVRGMAMYLKMLTQSTAGAWLRRDPAGVRDIDLRKAADEGHVVVFSLDSSMYPEPSSLVGGLIIQDLKTVSSQLRHKPAPAPVHVYVDEFSALESENIKGLLARARDAKMPVTVATQALADLARADTHFLAQLLGIVGSFIILRANAEADADVFAGLTSKEKVFKQQLGIEMASGNPLSSMAVGAGTGSGFLREDEQYKVTPQQFQELESLELVYIAKSPVARTIYPIKVIREDPSLASQVTRAEPVRLEQSDDGSYAETAEPGTGHTPAPSPFAAASTAVVDWVAPAPAPVRSRPMVPDVNLDAAPRQARPEPAVATPAPGPVAVVEPLAEEPTPAPQVPAAPTAPAPQPQPGPLPTLPGMPLARPAAAPVPAPVPAQHEPVAPVAQEPIAATGPAAEVKTETVPADSPERPQAPKTYNPEEW